MLEQTIQHHNEDEGFSKNDDLAFFDDGDDKVFMEGERLVVIREKKEDDTLKQIFEKEFSPKCTHDESSKTIQKPPRKSLEYRKSSERSSYSSHNSMPFYE